MPDPHCKPIQVIFGIKDDAGAAFLADDAMTVIGEVDDGDAVLHVARLCDGTKTLDEITSVATHNGMPPALVGQIVDTLMAEGILQDVAHMAPSTSLHDVQRANQLMAAFVGEEKLISTLDVYKPSRDADSHALFPYFTSFGHFTFRDGTPYVCHGSAPTAPQAVLKSVGEGVERHYNEVGFRIDAFCQARDLPHPYQLFEVIARQQDAYLQARGFRRFSLTDVHPWVLAHDLVTQAPVYIVADTVFHKLTAAQLKRPKVCDMIASGAAAHFERDDAIKGGGFLNSLNATRSP